MQEFWNNTAAATQLALITQSGKSLTYAQLYEEADSFAANLPEHSLIFICAANNISTLSAYLGCLRHGHVCLLISKDIKDSMLEDLVRLYAPNYIFKPGSDGIYHLQAGSEQHNREPIHPDLALLLSTSGSTGSPKLVRLTKKNLQANAVSIAEYLELDSSERPITNLPFYYSYGLSIVNSHLCAGATLLLTDDSIINPSFWSFCDTEGATSMAGVPYTYNMLEAVGFRKRAFPSLRYMTQAGGRMQANMVSTYAAWAKENNLRFYVMYGQTEATARMSYLPPEQALANPGSIGVPIPGGRFSIDSIKEEAGELIYSGENVCMGYAESRSDLALGDLNCGVLHTGDLAKVDSSGLYYITGRLKRFLKIAGNRFGLDELDSLFQNMGIEAVCGGDDTKLLVAITDESHKPAVAAYLKNTWHLMRTQYKIMVVSSIPRSSTGKILYSEIFQIKKGS